MSVYMLSYLLVNGHFFGGHLVFLTIKTFMDYHEHFVMVKQIRNLEIGIQSRIILLRILLLLRLNYVLLLALYPY